MQILPSGLPDEVDRQEDLARFLTQSSHFSRTIPKPSAFLPSIRSRETSISRHGENPADNLWAIGLAVASGRPLYGAAIFKALHVAQAGLEVVADEPPDRHAAIRGWPWIDTDPEMQKARQKEKAAILAIKSNLVLR